MSYDFILMRLSPTPRPGPISEVVTEDAHRPIDSAATLHAAVRASPLFAPGSLRFADDRRFAWSTPDGGQIEVTVISGVVSLRMHADWVHAAALFEFARGLWPDLMLLDIQDDEVHDPASFAAAIERNERDRAASGARAAEPPDDAG